MPFKLGVEIEMLTRAVDSVSRRYGEEQEGLTRATPPATNRPKAETLLIEAAPVA
jgi:hypothetical protein